MRKVHRHPRSSGLVRGYIERISSKAFDHYWKEITALVNHRHGIYALYRNNNLYYVGLATNLRNRVHHHLKDRHAGKWNYFSLYLVHSSRCLRELESLTMRIADPRGNRSQGKFSRAINLRPELKKLAKKNAFRLVMEIIDPDRLGLLQTRSRQHRVQERIAAARKVAKPRESRRRTSAALKGKLRSQALRGTIGGVMHRAWVMRSGRIKVRATGKIYDTPSGAAKAIVGHAIDGWHWWHFLDAQDNWVRLNTLRD